MAVFHDCDVYCQRYEPKCLIHPNDDVVVASKDNYRQVCGFAGFFLRGHWQAIQASTWRAIDNHIAFSTGIFMRKKSLKRNLLAAGLLLACASQAGATSYTFTDLGTLGGAYSTANAINASGEVAGWSYTVGGGSQRATLWNGTTATNLGALVTTSTVALGINASGQVAGFAYTPGNTGSRAILWNGATPTDLGTLGGAYGSAAAINASGQVVGWSNTTTGGNAYRATLWNGASVTNLGTLGGVHSQATAINDAGQIAGWAFTAGNAQHATLWNGTTATDLGTLGGTYSVANAINASGHVAGFSWVTGDAAQHATLWSGTTVIDLNSFLDASTVNAGWVLRSANGINDDGWIVGEAYNQRNGVQHAFLLSVAAVPEPEAYAMLLAGLGLIGCTARRRKDTAI